MSATNLCVFGTFMLIAGIAVIFQGGNWPGLLMAVIGAVCVACGLLYVRQDRINRRPDMPVHKSKSITGM